MSIKISFISEYLYCPVKLYLKIHLEDLEESKKEGLEKYGSPNPPYPNFYQDKQLLRDFQDLVRRNLWNVHANMDISGIENILRQDVNLLVQKYIDVSEDSSSSKDPVSAICTKLTEELELDVRIMALRVSKIIKNTKKEGSQIAEMIFPPSLQSYLMRDKSLQIAGSVDKIEIIEGKYFPITIKSKNPPLRGVWDSDALEIAAYSLLVEQEFDTDVIVGFVEYLKVGDRRPVVIDSEMREGLFIVLDHIREIINQGNLPEVSINQNKCLKCDYMEICHQET